jgi:hypothetical protein
MKRMIKLFMFAAIVAAFVVPALAQSKECNDENKSAWYDTFLKNRQGEAPQQKTAYEAAKNYLDSCPANPEDTIRAYLAKWAAAYEKALRKIQFEEAFVKKDYGKAADLGKQILADDPNNTRIYMLIGYGGYLGSSTTNTPISADSVENAKKAIEMIEAGKAPENWSPFTNKDQALAWLNYSIGKAKLPTAPDDALAFLIKAVNYNSELKKIPVPYTDIIAAYTEKQKKLTAEYEEKYKGKPETPESKLAAANIDQIIDREIDAYARLAALTTNPADKKAVMDDLASLYKYRNKSETGLNELVASVLSKPVPDVPTPITSLPTTSTPTSTPTNVGSPGTNGGAGNSGGAKPAGSGNTLTTGQTKTTSTSATGAQTGSAKPAASPTPRPKPRRSNHRVGM